MDSSGRVFRLFLILPLVLALNACTSSVTLLSQQSNTPTILLRSVGASVSQSANVSIALAAPSGLTAGDMEIAQVWTRDTGAATITAPSGWTQLRADSLTNGSTLIEQYFFYKVAGSAEPASYTFTASSSSTDGGVIFAYSGVNSISPVDVSTCSSGVSPGDGTLQLASTSNITTTQADERVLFTGLNTSSAGLPPILGFTTNWSLNDSSFGTGNFGCAKTLSSTGATSAISTNTMANGDDWLSCQIAISPFGTSTVQLRGSGAPVSTGSPTFNGTCITLSTPSGVQSGDLMVAQTYASDGGYVFSASGWTQFRSDNFSTSGSQVWYYKVASASEPTSYTFTQTGGSGWLNQAGGVIVAYSGANTSSPIDASGCSTGTSSNTSAPSITTTQANDLLLYTMQQNTNHNAYPDVISGYSQLWLNADSTNNKANFGGDMIQAQAGTVTSPSFQLDGWSSDEWMACQIALAP